MRLSQFILYFALLISTSVVNAQSKGAPEKATFLHQGLLKLEDDLLIVGRDNLPQDRSCPAGGNQVFENLFWIQNNLLSAMNSVDQLMENVKPTVQAKLADANRCGSCRQNNLVSSIASISPQTTVIAPQCEGRPSETFQLDLQSKKEIKNFTEDLLRGRSNEGKRLAAGCPNPCAYYVNTAQTILPNGKTHLTLTIQCGQPRRDSVFSAVYEYNAGVIHQWSCSK